MPRAPIEVRAAWNMAGFFSALHSSNSPETVASFHNASVDINFLDHYRLSFYGRNLSDERYARVVLIPPVSNFGQYNEPRNYGVEFSLKF